MTCPLHVVCSMYADAELEAAEAARLEEHLVGCASCAVRVAVLKEESRAIRATFVLHS